MDIFDFLQANAIPYQRYDHVPVYTCEQSNAVLGPIPGGRTKNLFLRDDKGKRHFLLTTRDDKQADLKRLSDQLGIKRLGFASADRLLQYLGVDPGSVTMLALINDTSHSVQLLIDRDVWSEQSLHCHPLVNTATLVIPRTELERFFSLTGHAVQLVDVPSRQPEKTELSSYK